MAGVGTSVKPARSDSLRPVACASTLAATVCLAQAAASSCARADVCAQLRIWEAAGMTARMAAPRLLAWRLLGGEVDAVVRPLQLDWRRALGTHLWCGRHCLTVLAL